MNSLLLHQLARSLLRRSFQFPLIRATSYLQFGLFSGYTFPEMLFPPASAFRVQYLKRTRSSTTPQFWSPLFRSSLCLFLLSTNKPMIQCNYYSDWATIHLWSEERWSTVVRSFCTFVEARCSCRCFVPYHAALFFLKSWVVVACCCVLLRRVWDRSNFFNNRNRG